MNDDGGPVNDDGDPVSSQPVSNQPGSDQPGNVQPGSDQPVAGEPVQGGPVPDGPRGLPAGHHRTHPLTPLLTGWKIVVGVMAVLTAQNAAQLAKEFTTGRLLFAIGALIVVMVVAVVLSALAWHKTSYAVDPSGVTLHSGILTKSRQFAPRSRIESVSIERPLLARLLGLAKVRVEIAGGGDDIDIQLVRSEVAEQLRHDILAVADETPSSTDLPTAGDGTDPELGTGPTVPAGQLRDMLHDGVTDGELIAEIPTERLIRALLRDVEFGMGVVMSAVGVTVAVIIAVVQDGFNFAVLIPLVPTLIALPKYILGRIEAGWGFVSRNTARGLRMRRGLANTRTDNIAAGRIQNIDLRRPLLWRSHGWTAAQVHVAGIDDSSPNGAQSVLPVGTREELALTFGHLFPPLGTSDDLATIEHLLTARAREIDGVRVTRRWHWIRRRTTVTVVLPGAVVRRNGVFTSRLQVVPRGRIQQLELADGPMKRRLGLLDLSVKVAGKTIALDALPQPDARELHTLLARDARTLRRYSERESWPRPRLAPGSAEAGQTPTQGAFGGGDRDGADEDLLGESVSGGNQ